VDPDLEINKTLQPFEKECQKFSNFDVPDSGKKQNIILVGLPLKDTEPLRGQKITGWY
jgi:hypothetical protein